MTPNAVMVSATAEHPVFAGRKLDLLFAPAARRRRDRDGNDHDGRGTISSSVYSSRMSVSSTRVPPAAARPCAPGREPDRREEAE